MRAEYQALKDNLAKQEIVNDKLLREAMRGKVGSINSKVAVSAACGIFVIIAAPFVFHFNPVIKASWWFVLATELLMFFAIFMDWKFNHKVSNTNLSTCDLLTFSKDVKKLKEDYKGWMKWAVLLSTAWGVWLCVETWFHSEEPKVAIGMIGGLVLGMVLGTFVGWRMNRKIIKTCDEIISNIEE